MAGYTVVSLTEVIESNPLPVGTTSQKAELIVFTRVLTLAFGQELNYTDSKYVFHILHSHTSVWEERGFFTTKGSSITDAPLILKLLRAARFPGSAAVICCKGHQAGNDPIIKGSAATTPFLLTLSSSSSHTTVLW